MRKIIRGYETNTKRIISTESGNMRGLCSWVWGSDDTLVTSYYKLY